MEPIVLAFITGLTTGGLSCLAVQGGLLAGSIASEVEQSVQNQPASVQRVKVGTAPQPQQMQPRASRPILLFLTAKLIAYTLLGFMLGWVGAVLQLTPMMPRHFADRHRHFHDRQRAADAERPSDLPLLHH